MTFAKFETTKTGLADLLKDAENGKMQLPDFQRGWVWDDYGIRSLLASISQSFPVGAIMTLQTGGDVRFRPRGIEGTKQEREPEFLLLDGQQRITSLYQACIRREVIETQNTQNRRIKRWYYIDMHKALDDAADREEAIIGVPEDKIVRTNFGRDVILDASTPEMEFESFMFPVNRLFDDREWERGFEDYWNLEAEKRLFYREFRDKVIEAFRSYQVPVIALGKETPKEAVCLVFEKVNTGGKKLDAFELLTAIYAADEFNLREDWYGTPRDSESIGRLPKLSEFEVLRDLASTDFLQAISLMHTLEKRQRDIEAGKEGKQRSQVSCTRQAILDLPLEAYRKWADPIMEGFVKAAKFLTMQKIFWRKDIPYKSQIVPLAAILAKIGDRWETDTARRKLARWYWCGVFGELYGSAIETRFAHDVQDVPNWLDEGETPRTVDDANFAAERLFTFWSRLSAAYKGDHALLMRKGGYDFKTGQSFELSSFWDEHVDIHHIFPRDWCQKVGGIPKERYDCIVNKTPIASRSNRIIGGSAPSKYLEKLQAEFEISAERLDEIVESHLIEATALRADDFDRFFAIREEALIKLIELAMGKAVARNVEPNEAMGELVEDEEELEELVA